MTNILFTCAGRRAYLLNYFKEQLGNEGLVIGTDMQLSAPALTVADVKEQVPAVYDDGYINCLLDICRRNEIRALISLNDLELPILARHRERFNTEGTFLIVSSEEVVDTCFDKYHTAQFVESIGLLTPKTYISIQEAKWALKENTLRFPLVMKPRWGSGSIGIEFVNSMEELDDMYSMLHRKVQKSILATASQGEDTILIQERIKGQEYGLDVMNDLRGNNRGVSVKKKLAMRAGETDKAQTVDNPAIRAIGHTLGERLHHIGNLDVDVFESDGKYYVLELNPRFGGGFPFSYEAGVNFPKAIIEWLKGNETDDSLLCPRYGKTFSKCDYLVEIK